MSVEYAEHIVERRRLNEPLSHTSGCPWLSTASRDRP